MILGQKHKISHNRINTDTNSQKDCCIFFLNTLCVHIYSVDTESMLLSDCQFLTYAIIRLGTTEHFLFINIANYFLFIYHYSTEHLEEYNFQVIQIFHSRETAD